MSRIVVGNVLVLTAGTKYDQDESRKDGKPIRTTVVTLSVTPTDAERIALAATEGQIVLALRNPLDGEPAMTNGVRVAELMTGQRTPTPKVVTVAGVRKAIVPPPPPTPVVQQPTSSFYRVEAFRASKRTEETVQ